MPKVVQRESGQCWTVAEVARHLRVSPEKVVRLIQAGQLRAANTEVDPAKRRSYRISPEALEAYLRGESDDSAVGSGPADQGPARRRGRRRKARFVSG